MKMYQLSIGFKDKDTKELEWEPVEAYEKVKELIHHICDGATCWMGEGLYKGVEEPSMQVQLYGIDEYKLKTLVHQICDTLNQECVQVMEFSTNVMYWS